jgi:hypothetical protein
VRSKEELLKLLSGCEKRLPSQPTRPKNCGLTPEQIEYHRKRFETKKYAVNSDTVPMSPRQIMEYERRMGIKKEEE